MKKLGKMARVVLGVLAVLVVLVIVGWIWIDAIVEAGIEKGGSAALGVETTVRSVSLSILGGSLGMEGLKVANPSGYASPHLMESGRFDVVVDRGSLFRDEIVMPSFELDGLDVNIEQTLAGNNVSDVMGNLKKSAPTDEKPAEPAEGGKSIRIEKVTVRNVVVHVSLPSPAPQKTINLPEIQLTDISSSNAGEKVIGELTGKLVAAVLQAVVEQVGSELPGDLASVVSMDVGGALKQLEPGRLAEQAGGALEGVLRHLPGAARDEADK